MKERLARFHEVAAFLGEEQFALVLEKWQNQLEQQVFYLPFIGQFAAGKSRLINNLIGRSILPTLGTESTSFITLIRYGEDQVNLYTANGQVPIGFPDLLDLHHSNIKNQPWNEESIERIEVHLNHELLKNGLILIDTPGVNTLIKNHEELSRSILLESRYLVYVLGKSVTRQDLTLIRQIDQLGISVIFVRTKLDDVKFSEENMTETVQNDKILLEETLQKQVRYFGLSNELDRVSAQLVQAFINFNAFISNEIAQNLSNITKKTLENRLNSMQKELESKLAEKKTFFEKHIYQDAALLEEQLKLINQQMSSVERTIRIRQKSTENLISPLIQQLELDLQKLQKKNQETLRENLKVLSKFSDLQQLGAEKAQNELNNFLREANQYVEQKLESFIEQAFSAYQIQLQELKNHWENLFDYSGTMKIEPPTMEELVEEHNYVLHKLEQELTTVETLLEQKSEELTRYNLKHGESTTLMEEVRKLKEQARSELSSHGDYVPKYKIIEGDHKTSDTFAKIGHAFDWITFFLPGDVIASGVNEVAQIADVADVVDDVPFLSQIKTSPDQTSKIMKTVDTFKDSLYLVKNIQDKVKSSPSNTKPGFLDMITLEYWFRKAGSIFDTPERMELDVEYQNAYNNHKAELTHKYQQYVRKELMQLEELNLIRSQEEKTRQEHDLNQKYQERILKELDQEKDRIRREIEDKAKEQYIAEIIRQCDQNIAGVLQSVSNELQKLCHQLTQSIVLSMTVKSQNELQKLKTNIEEIQKVQDQSASSIQKMQTEYERYFAMLREA